MNDIEANANEVDYEDLTAMRLDDGTLQQLLSEGGECVFNWTTREGYPVGVVVAFLYRDGKTASFKGDSIIHAPGDDGFDEIKSWFYPTLSGSAANPEDEYRQSFAKFLDSEHRVIIETEARLVVAFDVAKFQSFTNEAIQAGLGAQ